MSITVIPSPISGEISSPASKSHAHRLLIAAAFSDGVTEILKPGDSRDVKATEDCLRALGAVIDGNGERVTVTPVSKLPVMPILNCCESGSTLRFMLPIAAAVARDGAEFIGREGLAKRPILDLCRSLESGGAEFEGYGLPLKVFGRLANGRYEITGNESSQYITGLLFALSIIDGDSEIVLTTDLASAGYVDMTVDVLDTFGVKWRKTTSGWKLTGSHKLHSPGTVSVEGDWSGAAFSLSAGALSGPVTVSGLNMDSLHRDRAIADILKRFGADVTEEKDKITVRRGKRLTGCEIDLGDIPDLGPVISVVAATSEGKTRLINAGRLRMKESDRMMTICALINGLGGEASIDGDTIVICGGGLSGGDADSAGDHRIAMSAAVAACVCSDPVTIHDPMAVNKSYPGFYDDYIKLGGKLNGVELRQRT